MKSKIALLVVFNHRYDRNLPELRKRYKNKFSNVFYLMPFYDGEDEDVITVYCKSDTFQGFFAQAYQRLNKLGFDYWMVVADDMLLNPKLNEGNLIEILGMNVSDSFIPLLKKFDSDSVWSHARKSLSFTLQDPYMENKPLLPNHEETKEKLERYNVAPEGLSFETIYRKSKRRRKELLAAKYGLRYLIDKKKNEATRHSLRCLLSEKKDDDDNMLYAEYPFCYGYSDIFCIGSESLKEFCHLCGIFAASDLFVEIALPTALVMSTKGNIIQENDIEYRGEAILKKKNIDIFSSNYDYDIDNLIANFPKTNLYLHPIKISKWNNKTLVKE